MRANRPLTSLAATTLVLFFMYVALSGWWAWSAAQPRPRIVNEGQEVVTAIQAGQVSRVVVGERGVRLQLRDGTSIAYYNERLVTQVVDQYNDSHTDKIAVEKSPAVPSELLFVATTFLGLAAVSLPLLALTTLVAALATAAVAARARGRLVPNVSRIAWFVAGTLVFLQFAWILVSLGVARVTAWQIGIVALAVLAVATAVWLRTGLQLWRRLRL